MLTDLLEFTLAAARAAGAVLLDRFEGDLQISTKSSAGDLVTDADRAAEAVILNKIRATYPDHAILAEESGDLGSTSSAQSLRWVVDPLDGTTNFAHRLPHFSVSIALVDDDGPLVGVVHDPSRDETFYAARDRGAWLDSPRTRARDRHPRRLAVTSVTNLREALVATGFPYVRDTARANNLPEVVRVVPQIRCMRRAGSAALDLAYVAAGRLDGYWESGLAPWDIAAGALLVREAGGAVHRMNGRPWQLAHADIVAGNPSLVGLLTAELIAARPTT